MNYYCYRYGHELVISLKSEDNYYTYIFDINLNLRRIPIRPSPPICYKNELHPDITKAVVIQAKITHEMSKIELIGRQFEHYIKTNLNLIVDKQPNLIRFYNKFHNIQSNNIIEFTRKASC